MRGATEIEVRGKDKTNQGRGDRGNGLGQERRKGVVVGLVDPHCGCDVEYRWRGKRLCDQYGSVLPSSQEKRKHTSLPPASQLSGVCLYGVGMFEGKDDGAEALVSIGILLL